MGLPSGLTAKTVTFGLGTFANGDVVDGTVTITAPVNLLHVPTGSPIFSSAMTQRLVNGQATFELCPTDHPDLNRRDWTYSLVAKISGALKQPDPVSFLLPTAGPDTVDLDTLVSVPSSAGTPVSVSVATTTGPNTWTGTQDFTGATVTGVAGAVSSVAGQTGAVTGTQIAADPALKAAFVRRWQASTAYTAGDLVLSPNGQVVAAKTSFTSAASYVAANWKPAAGGVFNVMDFGAKGDGTTDDTAAIQAALTAVPTAGGTVFLPAGVYSVPNGGLTCANPVRIVGVPGLDGTGTRILVTADAVTGLSLSGNRSTVEHLDIAHVLTGTRSASLVGLSVTNANFCRLDGVRVEGFATDCKIANGIYYSVLNCNFRDFVNVGLDYSNTAQDAGDGTIFGCTFDRGSDTVVGGTACLWHSGGGMRFENNKINGKSGGGAYFTDGLSMVLTNGINTGVMIVTGNSFENFQGAGFKLVHNDTANIFNTVVITGNEFSGLDATAASTGIYVDEDTTGVVITGNHIYTVQTGIFVDRIKHVAISGNSLTNIQQTGIHVGSFPKAVKIDPQPIDVIAGGSDVLFDNPKVVADPCWEKVIPFGGANGSNMPVINDNLGHDQVEIDLFTGFNTVIVEIEVTGVVAGNGAWAARQLRMIGGTNGVNATIQTIGTDFAYQGTGAVVTQTAAVGSVKFGVQKLAGTDLSGHLRIKVRGAGLAGFKQINRYN